MTNSDCDNDTMFKFTEMGTISVNIGTQPFPNL